MPESSIHGMKTRIAESSSSIEIILLPIKAHQITLRYDPQVLLDKELAAQQLKQHQAYEQFIGETLTSFQTQYNNSIQFGIDRQRAARFLGESDPKSGRLIGHIYYAVQFRTLKGAMLEAVTIHRKALENFEILSGAMHRGYELLKNEEFTDIGARVLGLNRGFLQTQEKILAQQCEIFNEYYPQTPQIYKKRYGI